MISKTSGFMATQHFQTHPYCFKTLTSAIWGDEARLEARWMPPGVSSTPHPMFSSFCIHPYPSTPKTSKFINMFDSWFMMNFHWFMLITWKFYSCSIYPKKSPWVHPAATANPFVPSDASLYTAQKELRGIFRGWPKVEDFGLGAVEIGLEIFWGYPFSKTRRNLGYDMMKDWCLSLFHVKGQSTDMSCQDFHGHSMSLHVSCFKSRPWYVYCVSCMSKHLTCGKTSDNYQHSCQVFHMSGMTSHQPLYQKKQSFSNHHNILSKPFCKDIVYHCIPISHTHMQHIYIYMYIYIYILAYSMIQKQV